MKTVTKVLLMALATFAYIVAVTYLFEYTINEVSSTALTTGGLVTFIILTGLFGGFVVKLLKK